MDKKLLVSLMMTAPVAAFANGVWVTDGSGNLSYQIKPQVDQDNWKADGIADYQTDNDVLTCPVSTGFLSHNAMMGAAGSYTFAVDAAVNVKFEVNGEIQYVKNDKGQYLDAAGNVTTKPAEYVFATSFKIVQVTAGAANVIKVLPIDKDLQFQVGTANLTLDFNFSTAKSNLSAEFGKVILNEVPEADTRKAAKDLRAQLKTLTADQTAISKNLASIDLADASKLLAAWNNLNLAGYQANLAKATDAVSVAILKLQNAAGLADAAGKYPADSYNGKVAAETQAWNNIKANEASLAAINAKIAQLKADLAAKKNVENDVPASATADEKAYCKLALASELKAQEDAIATLEAAVKAAFVKDAEGNLPTTVVATDKFNSDADKISGDIAAISAANALADWVAYNNFVKAVADQAYQYDTLFGQINNNYRVTEYTINGKKYTIKNVYDDVTGDANNALAEAYQKNTGYAIEEGAIVDGKFVPAEFEKIIGANSKYNTTEYTVAENVTVEGVKGVIKYRLKGMLAAEAALKAIYDDQEAQLNGNGGADDIITALQTTCNSYKAFAQTTAFKALTATDQAKLNQLIANMEAAIANLCTVTNERYLAHKLNVDADPFAAAKTAVDNADEAYNEYLKITVGLDVIDLIKASNDAREYVKTQTGTVKGYGSTLNSKFDSSFQNIDDAIAKYYGSNPREPQAVNDINDAIDVVKDACDKLVSGFNGALAVINNADNALKSFEKQLNGKLLVAGPEQTKYNKTADQNKYNAFAEKVAGYKADLDKAVAEENVQEAYEAAVAATKIVNDENIAPQIVAAQDAFVKAATEKNSANVGAMIADINKYTGTEPYKNYPGMSGVDLVKDVEGGFAKVEELYAAEDAKIAPAGADTVKLDAIDQALQNLVDKCAGVNAKIKAVLENHAAYKDLCNIKDQYAGAIKDYQKSIRPDQLTVDPAAQHYTDKLQDLLEELKTVETAYGKSYNEVTEVADKAGHKAALDAINKKFQDLQADLLENQKNFSILNGIADELSVKINAENGTLNQYDEVEYTEDFKKQVEDLTQRLGNLNDKVTVTFGEGGLTDLTTVSNYKDEYNKLQAELEAIIDAWTDGYHSAVKDANNAWLGQHNLGAGFLDGKYKDAIAYVNEYLYNVYNVNYYQLLVNNPEFIENHNELQACFKKIEKLTYQLNRFVDFITPVSNDPSTQKVLGYDQTGSLVVDYQGDKATVTIDTLVADAASIVNTIETTVAAIDAKGLEVANNFWAANGEVADEAWNNITSRLAAAGLSVEGRAPGEESEIDQFYGAQLSVLNSMLDAYDQLQADIKAGKEFAVHKYILDMDNFANIIDGKPTPRSLDDMNLLPPYGDRDDADVTAFENEKVYAAINALWPERVNDTNSKLNKLLEEIADYDLDPNFAKNKKVITDAISSVNALNTAWGKHGSAQHEAEFADYQKQLNDLLNGAQVAVDAAKAAHEIVVNNNEVIKQVITNPDSYYNQGLDNIDDLLAWSSYRENQLEVIDGLKDALEAAKAQVYANVTNTKKANVQDQAAVIEAVSVTDVDNAYIQIFGQEKAFANDLMVLLRSAFNNVNLKYSEDGISEAEQAQLDGWDAQIKALEKQLREIVYKVKDRKGCMDALKGCESAIDTLLVELQAIALDESTGVNTDTKADALDALNAQVGSVNAAIDAFKADVDGATTYGEGKFVNAEKDAFNAQADALTAELAAIESAFNADGDDVIKDAAKFVYDMQQLLDKLAGVESDWDVAYNGDGSKKGALQKDYSDYRYVQLTAEIDNLWNSTEYAAGEGKTHRNANWSYQLYNYINQTLNGYTDNNGVFHNGDKQKLAALAKTWDITSATSLTAGIQDDVYSFVRETLLACAVAEQNIAINDAQALINEVQNPGVNDYGFAQSFIDAESIWKAILAEGQKVQNLNLGDIIQYLNASNVWVATNPDQAKTAYEALMAQIDEAHAAMGDIYDKAVADNLIVKGDVNDDAKVNILDVQKLIDLVAEKAVFDGSKDSHIADVNSDNDINVGDVTTLINWVMGQDQVGPNNIISKIRKFMPTMGGSNSYNVYEVQGENGLRRFAVLLTNETAFTAGQLDIVLPGHATVAGVSLGDRANGLDAYVRDNGDCTTVVMTSLDNTMIDGNNGCVLFIDVEGNAEVEVENVIFSDKNGNAYKLNSNGESGVGILDSMKDGVKAIYNAAGQKLNKLTKGVNIIRNADGTTTKKMGK